MPEARDARVVPNVSSMQMGRNQQVYVTSACRIFTVLDPAVYERRADGGYHTNAELRPYFPDRQPIDRMSNVSPVQSTESQLSRVRSLQSAVFQGPNHRSCCSPVVKRMERNMQCTTLEGRIAMNTYVFSFASVFVPVALGFSADLNRQAEIWKECRTMSIWLKRGPSNIFKEGKR